MAKKSAKDMSAESTEGRMEKQVGRPAMSGLQADVLALQRTVGNQAVSQLLQQSAISNPSSADVKDQVETTQNSSLKPLPSAHASPADAKGLPASVRSVLSSSGQPLDPITRTFMQSRFGYDLSPVRVHIGEQAARSAQAVNASAYTVGRDIVLGAGQYAPPTTAGWQLLTHELVHTIQQRPTGIDVPSTSPHSPSEHAADTAAQHVMRGNPVGQIGSAPLGIARRALEPLEEFEGPDDESLLRNIERLTDTLKSRGVLSEEGRKKAEEELKALLEIFYKRTALRPSIRAKFHLAVEAEGVLRSVSETTREPTLPLGEDVGHREAERLEVPLPSHKPEADLRVPTNRKRLSQIVRSLPPIDLKKEALRMQESPIETAPFTEEPVETQPRAPVATRLVQSAVKELDGSSRGKVLLGIIVATRSRKNLKRWALELQAIPHSPYGNYLHYFFIQFHDYSPNIAAKFVEILTKEGIAVSPTSGYFQSLEHLDPAETVPLNPEVANVPVSRWVDNFVSVKYDLEYKPRRPGLLSELLQVTYVDGVTIDIDIRHISDNRDDAWAQAFADAYLGPGGRIFPSRMSPSTTPKLWREKQKAIAKMEASNLEFETFTSIALAGVQSSLPAGPVVAPAPQSAPTVMRRTPRASASSSSVGRTEAATTEAPQQVSAKAAKSSEVAPSRTPPPIRTTDGEKIVWVNTREGKYHTPDSPWYGKTKEGVWMREDSAKSTGFRKAKAGRGLEAARRGQAEHAMVAKAQRPHEGKLHAEGWRLEKVERTVGGKKRVDELWVNDKKKRIFVADTYTGKVEPPRHHEKGWAYANEPEVKSYIDKGYTYDYSVAIKHPEKLH